MAGTTHSHRRVAGPVRGFTLIEIMVVIAIIATLIGISAFSVSAVHEWGRKNTAKQQLALLANAIDKYAESWKRWEVQAGSVGRVVIAEKGWPDFIPGRLFAPANLNGRYQQLTDPDNVPFNDHLTYSLSPFDRANSGVYYDNATGDEMIEKGDVEAGAEALFYALTSSAMKGPFVDESTMKANLQVTHETERYPAKSGTGTTSSDLKRGEFVDPWGKPYRYFWIYRDTEPTSSSARSINGFLAVDYGALRAGGSNVAGSVLNPGFYDGNNFPKTAVGYVIESAGPDGNFGNVWQPANLATPKEIEDADDNLVLRVP